MTLIAKITPKAAKFFAKKAPLTQEESEEIEAGLNALGQKKVSKIHVIGTFVTLPFVFIFWAALALPWFLPAKTIFAGWEGFVVSMPSWSILLMILPGFMIASVVGGRFAVLLVRIVHKIRWPRESSRYLHYVGEASSYGVNGFKVAMDYERVGRIFLKIGFASYIIVLAIFYFSNDVVTQTQYHSRSILPFLNQTVPHGDLVYTFENSSSLYVRWTSEDTLLSKHAMNSFSAEQGERIIATIAEIKTVTLVRQTVD